MIRGHQNIKMWIQRGTGMRCEQVLHISEEQDNIAGTVRGKFRPQVTKSQLYVIIPGQTKRRWRHVCSWWPMNTPHYFQTPCAASGKQTPALSTPLSDIMGREICHLQFMSSTFSPSLKINPTICYQQPSWGQRSPNFFLAWLKQKSFINVCWGLLCFRIKLSFQLSNLHTASSFFPGLVPRARPCCAALQRTATVVLCCACSVVSEYQLQRKIM